MSSGAARERGVAEIFFALMIQFIFISFCLRRRLSVIPPLRCVCEGKGDENFVLEIKAKKSERENEIEK
jgi:hypothetical protein